MFTMWLQICSQEDYLHMIRLAFKLPRQEDNLFLPLENNENNFGSPNVLAHLCHVNGIPCKDPCNVKTGGEHLFCQYVLGIGSP